MSAWQVAAFLACVAAATCAHTVTGFAMALILLGLTSLLELAPLADVANVATVMSLASAAIALRGARKSVDRELLLATITGSVLGYAIGVALLAWLSANVVMVLRLLLGLVVIACAVIVLVRAEPLAQRSSRLSLRGFGVVSGVLGGLFSASGPPLVYQYYRQPLPVDTIRDTLVAALAAGSLVRLVMVVPSGQFSAQSLFLCLIAAPVAIAVTWWFRRYPPAWPRAIVLRIVCALLVVTGVGLIASAVGALVR